ncbi:hypothetical protein J9100_004161 [Vibrio vulnificus]|uniref:Uncharacterized protein n=1 Tax=Vibrio mediterranei TaxID=689 RepID=B2XSM6_9VIBR|nr:MULTISPECIES: hypothetical protein [Vibrio]ABX56716.1 hypothetical protein [Vibrio mediterranei]EHI9242841.1 hypothetical protein [Vibrio vulnificus]UAY45949.1 hypothetical protein K9N54_26475 [Vibrio parahaemolyticus]HCG7304686.1 hypothetical protein [Vibrio parahaemolyticus]
MANLVKFNTKLALTDMIWTAEPRNALKVIRAYCPFINSGELAADITEQALKIDEAYRDNESAQELDKMMLALKQKATGINIADARMMGLIPNYQDTLDNLPFCRNAIGVDLLTEEGFSYE